MLRSPLSPSFLQRDLPGEPSHRVTPTHPHPPLAARGFPIRFALRVAGVAFEDERLPREELHSRRGSGGFSPEFPLGQLPVLRIDGELFTESVALSRWAARKSALYPQDELAALRVEEFIAIIDELWTKVPLARNIPDAEALRAARIAFPTAVAPRFLERLSARVARSGGPFVLGGGLPTLADVWLVAFAEQLRTGAYSDPPGIPTDLLRAYPKLDELVTAFKSHGLFLAHGEPM